jgi:uncharacterized protein YcfL
MKKWITIALLGCMLVACQSNDSTQNIRDNETTDAAEDVTDNYETERDTTAHIPDTVNVSIPDSTEIR